MPLKVSDGIGTWIDDFKKSKAPQFKGKSEKERRDMAIAAYLSAKRGGKPQEENVKSSDRKPEVYTKPDGKKGVRMVPVDTDIVTSEGYYKDQEIRKQDKKLGNTKENEFKPHMMYDPKTGKAYKAEKPEDHERMSKMGYTHEKPEMKESVNEAKDQSTDRLRMLVRLGLMDKKDMSKIVRSITKMKEDKPVSPADRKILFDLLNELIGMVTGDEQMFQKAKKAVREEKDPNEYDKEGEMMKNQLRQICSANEKLMDMVGDDDNLPEWVQNKVTKATDYIRSVRDYLEAENSNESTDVQELSSPTLKSYIKKAEKQKDKYYSQYQKLRRSQDKKHGEFSPDQGKTKEVGRKAVNRDDGLYRAYKTLTRNAIKRQTSGKR
jgi:hypothetical protein